jgi:hypothetical protein
MAERRFAAIISCRQLSLAVGEISRFQSESSIDVSRPHASGARSKSA